MQPEPNMDNGGRWHHIASEAEVRRALRDKQAEIIEVPMISMSYYVSSAHLTTLRCGAAGGDVFSVEGGWVYPNDIAQRLDKMELRQLAENTRGVSL